MNFYFILLTITFALPNFGMELPQDQATQNRVPSLVELAARKCQKATEPFDPSKGYQRAVHNLTTRAICHAVGTRLAPELARSNAQTLQTILDDAIIPPKLHTAYEHPINNLYETNHGIWDHSSIFFPRLGQDQTTKYRSMVISADKTICVSNINALQLILGLWDVNSGNLIKQIQYPLQGQNYADLQPVKLSADKKMLFARFREDLPDLPNGKPHCVTHMCAFDVATGQLLYENMNAGWGFCVGKKYMYVPKPNGLQVRDSSTNVLLKIISISTGNQKVSYCISPEDDYLCDVPLNWPKSIFIISVPQEKLLQVLDCKDVVQGMRLNNLGTRLAALTQNAISIWEPRTGKQLALIPHTKEPHLQLIDFADNDRTIYTQAHNIVAGWDIEKQILLFSKEIAFAGDLKDAVHLVNIIKQEDAALIWTRLGGQKLHALYTTLGKKLSLKELSALLVLEYEDKHNLPFSPAAVEIVQNSENSLLKRIYESRYNTVTAEAELESAARVSKMQDRSKTNFA